MRLDNLNKHSVKVTLSRRNLLTLLSKLDGFPENSECTLVKREDEVVLIVTAEEDGPHYSIRGYPPGEIHKATDTRIKQWYCRCGKKMPTGCCYCPDCLP